MGGERVGKGSRGEGREGGEWDAGPAGALHWQKLGLGPDR